MVRIRLRRIGARHRPFYRIVVADQRTPRNGKVIEEIGTYDPMQDPPAININEDSAVKWLRNGAMPSDAVAHMLKSRGITDKAAASA